MKPKTEIKTQNFYEYGSKQLFASAVVVLLEKNCARQAKTVIIDDNAISRVLPCSMFRTVKHNLIVVIKC